MYQDLCARLDTSYKTDPLEQHSPNTVDSWTSSKAEQFPVKMQMSGGAFIPTINAITSSQELQWMVQPAVLSGSCLRPHPYGPPAERSSPGPVSHARLGVIRAVGRSRRHSQLSPDEEDRRRLRRERNKLAAAKCRNRRRELTDQLQEETEELEEEQASLQTQVDELQDERHRLEFVLASHVSVCRLHARPSAPLPPPLRPSGARPHPRAPPKVKQEPVEELLPFSPHHEPSARPACRQEDPAVDCFDASSVAVFNLGRVMDLSGPLPGPCRALEGRDGDRGASPGGGEALSKDLLSKLQPASAAMTLEDRTLAPLYSPTLLTL